MIEKTHTTSNTHYYKVYSILTTTVIAPTTTTTTTTTTYTHAHTHTHTLTIDKTGVF